MTKPTNDAAAPDRHQLNLYLIHMTAALNAFDGNSLSHASNKQKLLEAQRQIAKILATLGGVIQ